MIMKFVCSKCKKEQFICNYDTEEQVHNLICLGCGRTEAIEYLLNKKKAPEIKMKERSVNKPSEASNGSVSSSGSVRSQATL